MEESRENTEKRKANQRMIIRWKIRQKEREDRKKKIVCMRDTQRAKKEES